MIGSTFMKKRILFLLFLIATIVASSIVLAGTTGKISGKIVDKQTGEVIPGVNITVVGVMQNGHVAPMKGVGAISDIYGQYVILNIPPGEYSVEASMFGYKKMRVDQVHVQVDRTNWLNYKLESTDVLLDEVVIIADRRMVVKDQTSASAKVSSEDIKALPVQNYQDILQLQAGVTVDNNGNLHVRGGRTSEIKYYIDGIEVTNPIRQGEGMPVENNSIQELEVISGTFNAEYGQALSAVVNIVTKEGSNRYSGSFSAYGGDFFTNNSAFWGLNQHEIRQKYLEASFGGPLPGLNDVKFFISGRLADEKNPYYGRRVYNIYDFSSISSSDTSLWHIERTGDGSLVPMGPSKSISFNGKLSIPLPFSMKAIYAITGGQSEFKIFDNTQRYNPDYEPTYYRRDYDHRLRLEHTLGSNLFYTFNLSYATTSRKSYVFSDPMDPRYAAAYARPALGINIYSTGGVDDGRTNDDSKTFAARFDLTSQVNFTHLIKIGAEYRTYDLSQEFYHLIIDPNTYGDMLPHIPPLDKTEDNYYYNRRPYEAAAYVQDKIEINDLIVNLGLRFDYFNANSVMPKDFKDPANDIFPRSYDSAYTKVNAKYKLSPRLGFAFPLTERGVIHASYGEFFQIPALPNLFQNPNFKIRAGSFVSFIGNADLEPQRSSMYELGLQQQLMDNLRIDVTAFYRDERNLLGTRLYQTYDASKSYGRYFNVDYGGVQGLTLSLELFRSGQNGVSGTFDYTYQSAKGNGSDPQQAFFDARNKDESAKMLVPLDWDIRHNIAATLNITSGDWGASFIATFRTGYPRTPTLISNPGAQIIELRNGDRGFSTYNVNMNVYRNIDLYGMRIQLFARVDNLLDYYTDESVPHPDPINVNAFVINNLYLLNSYYEFANNPGNYPTPRRIMIGARLEF